MWLILNRFLFNFIVLIPPELDNYPIQCNSTHQKWIRWICNWIEFLSNLRLTLKPKSSLWVRGLLRLIKSIIDLLLTNMGVGEFNRLTSLLTGTESERYPTKVTFQTIQNYPFPFTLFISSAQIINNDIHKLYNKYKNNHNNWIM